jgi:extracellular factor (EF) 3-hydroxypalmitic acid methyl ester biosynthesis protein
MATIDGRSTHRKGRSRQGPHIEFDALTRETTDRLLAGLLEDAHRTLGDLGTEPQQFRSTMDEMIVALRTKRLNSSESEWRRFVETCRLHPLKDELHEDPFTFRAYSKPRGYPGDAELLDYIYGREELWPPPEASPLGQRIFDYTTLAPAPEGVRARRGFAADALDRLAVEVHRPHVLSVAAGHLREASLAASVKRRQLGRLVAMDNDAESLREIERSYGGYGVETLHASVRRLLGGQLDLGRFDLVYVLGLLDYLRQPIARRLFWGMFQMLRPGGRAVAANFLPGVRDVGYMEVFMDWFLVYRTRQEMVDITMEISQAEIRDITLFAEENQNIVFVQVTKA